MTRSGRHWLIGAAVLDFAAALLHVGCIVGGGPWYRFFGAGEGMARLAEQGSPMPGLITVGIAAILSAWGFYALSGAGAVRRLPLLRTGLVLITIIYALRAALLPHAMLMMPAVVDPFLVWSSLIVLIYGIVHAIGLIRAWPSLTPR